MNKACDVVFLSSIHRNANYYTNRPIQIVEKINVAFYARSFEQTGARALTLTHTVFTANVIVHVHVHLLHHQCAQSLSLFFSLLVSFYIQLPAAT